MKASEIKVGGVYEAKVSNRLTEVRVDGIEDVAYSSRPGTRYHVFNLKTGRKTVFRSAMKFRREVRAALPVGTSKCNENAPPQGADMTEHLFCEGSEPDCCESAPGDDECMGCGRPVRAKEEAPKPKARHAFIDRPSPVPSLREGTGLLSQALRQDAAKPQAPHLIVEARAGTGKTTTLIEGLKRMRGLPSTIEPSPQQAAVWAQMMLSKDAASVCFCAFNKAIATELQSRVPRGCEAMTMHSMGFRAVQKAFGRQEPNGYVVQDHISAILGRDIRELRKSDAVLLKATEDLVGLCKMNLVGFDIANGSPLHPAGVSWETALAKLAGHYEIELNGSRDKVFELVPQVLERCKTPKGRIGFDDMIWLPIVHNLPVQQYDLLLVDEAQDLNRCQQALAKKAGKRLILVGDPRQAIYGFAGADAESMPRMARELGVTSPEGLCSVCGEDAECKCQGCRILPLTVTRRCGKAIVNEARKYVPDFEAHESNGEGRVLNSHFPVKGKTIDPAYLYAPNDGDMVLCRCNAPLVSECFRFLKMGRKAQIQGRDIGAGLISTIKKLTKDTTVGVVELMAMLSDWMHAETRKEEAKREPNETRLQTINDRYECLCCFCDGARTSLDVITKIQSVFTDDKKTAGIKLSSIHKAKGLEANRVFILQLEKACCPAPWAKLEWERAQEVNLLYVAITRAIEELVYVS